MHIQLISLRARRISFGEIFVLILLILNDSLLVHSTPASSSFIIRNGRQVSTARMNLPRAVAASHKFVCKDPQARAYNLRDLMQSLGLHEPGESANQPVYTVLKRCDVHSGCCMSPDMSCSPIKTYFEDIEIEVWSLETNETKRQWIRVEQHAKCSCEVTNGTDRERLAAQKPNVTVLR